MSGPLVAGSGARAYVVVDGLEAESQSSVGLLTPDEASNFLKDEPLPVFFS